MYMSAEIGNIKYMCIIIQALYIVYTIYIIQNC